MRLRKKTFLKEAVGGVEEDERVDGSGGSFTNRGREVRRGLWSEEVE